MISIAYRFVKTEEENILLNNMSYVELFYNVYKQVDYLTLRELKVLRNFCYALYDPYDLTIVSDHRAESEDDIYYKYSNLLDNYVDEKTKIKKYFNARSI